MNIEPNEGDLRVWWIPKVPGKAFYVPVGSVEEGLYLQDVLAEYDLFQIEQRVKPDYSNVGGLQIFVDGDWEDYDGEELERDQRTVDRAAQIRQWRQEAKP